MEDIVKTLNTFVKSNYNIEGTFIGHKKYFVDKAFGIMRHYKLCLYYHNKGKDNIITEDSITIRADDTALEKNVSMKFLEMVLDFVASDEFRDLMDGTTNI